ncbi:MAG TPA: hypothetical protein VGR53_06780 [Nitrososphaerales archaeon]|nr:hypothetical protein [Nitrososphaerales archaeon]
MKAARMNSPPREVAPDETHAAASKSFKSVELRLLMKEREDVVSRLVALDYRIWVLEEIYRREPEMSPPSIPGTPVPKGSLTSEGGKPQR